MRATVEAVRVLSDERITLLTSTDPFMWDLVTARAAAHGMEMKLIVKHDSGGGEAAAFERLLSEYDLNPGRTEPVFLGAYPGNQPKKLWTVRDRYAAEAADIIYPVSINPRGKLAALITEPDIAPKVRDTFRIPWQNEEERSRIPAYEFPDSEVNPFLSGDWLVHWTRTSQGKWPGESMRAFVRDMYTRPEIYVRNACETLVRMLDERCIRGSSWNMPENTEAVSFSALSAAEAIKLMRWRKRYVRYSFEPYGIAVKQEAAAGLGAREVRYEQPGNSCSGDRLFVQSPGERGDWASECEWRLRGDLRLDRIDPRDWFAVVYNESDMSKVKRRLGSDELYIHVLKRQSQSLTAD